MIKLSDSRKTLLKQLGELALNLLIIPWIASRLKTGRDRDRAILIQVIATGVVAELIAEKPNLSWIRFVEEVVRRLGAAIPESAATENESVLWRAAYAAIAAAGVKAPKTANGKVVL